MGPDAERCPASSFSIRVSLMNIAAEIHTMGERATAAALAMAQLSEAEKNTILLSMADEVEAQSGDIVAANATDLEAGREKGLSEALLDRLGLDQDRLKFIAGCIRQVAALPDPVGEVLAEWDRPNGIRIEKRRVPIGVIGIIFESRPNVTSDAATLCFKSGNATILRGGSEAIHSNRALAKALVAGGVRSGMPEHAIQLIPFTDRESVKHLAEMDQHLDLIIPRGGKGLIEAVVSQARMPVIKHYDGICHLFVDSEADLEMALDLTIDAKTQKPSVCNALETLLVAAPVAAEFLPRLEARLREKGVEIRADEAARAILPNALPATEEDWSAEYLDLILAVKVVDDLDAAVDHINQWSSRHSDCIVTESPENAERFLAEIDSAAVFWNVSTRFSDGEEFGFGAEIGISTDKLHARGPMGLNELTSYKYLVRGAGQTKAG